MVVRLLFFYRLKYKNPSKYCITDVWDMLGFTESTCTIYRLDNFNELLTKNN